MSADGHWSDPRPADEPRRSTSPPHVTPIHRRGRSQRQEPAEGRAPRQAPGPQAQRQEAQHLLAHAPRRSSRWRSSSCSSSPVPATCSPRCRSRRRSRRCCRPRSSAPPTSPPAATPTTRSPSSPAARTASPSPTSSCRPSLVQAVLAAEDRTFYDHGGVDPVGIVRALWANLRSDERAAGRLDDHPAVREERLPDPGAHHHPQGEGGGAGGEARARAPQAGDPHPLPQHHLLRPGCLRRRGRVAGLLRQVGRRPHPPRRPPTWPASSARPRPPTPSSRPTTPSSAPTGPPPCSAATRCSQAMVETGDITQAQYDEYSVLGWDDVPPALDQGELRPRRPPRAAAPSTSSSTSATGCTTEGGFTDAEVYGGGLRVYTTLDMENQEEAVDAVTSTLDQPDDPAAALVSIDETGAGAGDGRWPRLQRRQPLRQGQPGRRAPRAAAAVASPGSSFKPFVLAEAMNQGISLNQTYDAPAQDRHRGRRRRRRLGRRATTATPSQGTLDLVQATAEVVEHRLRAADAWTWAPRTWSPSPAAWASPPSSTRCPSLVLGTGERVGARHGLGLLDLRRRR